MMTIKQQIFLFASLIALTSCNFQPKYQTPKSTIVLEPSPKENITTISWENFFNNKELQQLINLALKNNQDLKIATLNIAESQATYNISKSSFLPSIEARASQTKQGAPEAFAAFTPRTIYRANLTALSYELDFFGRLRNIKESALQDFLATKEARNIAQISLVSQIVSSYTQFLSNQELLAISAEKVQAQKQKYTLAKALYNNGVTSQSEFLEAESNLENEQINYQQYKKSLIQNKNELMILSGIFDHNKLPFASSLNTIKINEKLLEFTPSHALLARPDIRQAEHHLKAANADIGAARAAFFPTIVISGNYGYSSRKIHGLFSHSSKSWSFIPQISVPIFNGGANIADLKIANIRKKIEIANYEKAIQTAFTEVLNELESRRLARENLTSTSKILRYKKQSYNISKNKNKMGINSMNDVLDSKLALLTAKQNHVLSQSQYIISATNLYKALGGGSR